MASWIKEAQDMGLEPDVEEIKLLDEELGNPEQALPDES